MKIVQWQAKSALIEQDWQTMMHGDQEEEKEGGTVESKEEKKNKQKKKKEEEQKRLIHKESWMQAGRRQLMSHGDTEWKWLIKDIQTNTKQTTYMGKFMDVVKNQLPLVIAQATVSRSFPIQLYRHTCRRQLLV